MLKFIRFVHVRNLKNRAPVQAGAQFLQNRVFFVCCQKHPKIIKKSMDFEVENREKSMQERVEKTSFFHIDFSSIFRRFWPRFGGSWGGFGRHLAIQKDPSRAFKNKRVIWIDFGRALRGFGRVL